MSGPVGATPERLLAEPSDDGEAVGIGSGAPLLVEALRTAGRPARIGTRDGTPLLDAQPDIAAVAACAALSGGALPPEPLYLRGADAKPSPPSPALAEPIPSGSVDPAAASSREPVR